MKSDLASSVLYPVMERFYTLQGEGFHSGKAAYFIRLAGCDVGCHWCDVKESWPTEGFQKFSSEELVKDSLATQSDIVVITGGEPTMHDLNSLTHTLASSNKKAHIETAGVYPLTGKWDWVCFSPKKFKKPLEEYYTISHELKVIVCNKSDLAWAEGHAKKMNNPAKLYLQPEWDRRHEVMPMIVDHIKANPKWQVSLQVHKYLDIP